MAKHKVEEKSHAVLGPSGWDRWSNCPGSVPLSEGLPKTTSVYAAEGTVMHEVADRVLRGELADAEDMVGEVFHVEQHDIVFDMELADAVNDYVATVHQFINVGDGDVLMPEQQVPIGHLTGETGAEGTADVIGIVADGKRLVVIDLKGGKGVRVTASTEEPCADCEGTGVGGVTPQERSPQYPCEVCEGRGTITKINGQGGMYALGALEKFGMVYDEIEEVEIVICQPRVGGGTTSVIVSLDELRAFGAEVEQAAGAVAIAQGNVGNADQHFSYLSPEDQINVLGLTPGEKQCKFCPAKGICPALAAEVRGSLIEVTACDPSEFDDLTMPKVASAAHVDEGTLNERLAEFLRAVPLIEDFISGVRAEVERRLFDGQEIPGFYLGVGRQGNRQWASEMPDPETKEMKPVNIETELKKRLGAKETYVKKVISPTEAEKKFKDKPRTWAKIAPLITRAEGKPSVCREGDKNPLYQLPSPDDFADLTADAEAEALLG